MRPQVLVVPNLACAKCGEPIKYSNDHWPTEQARVACANGHCQWFDRKMLVPIHAMNTKPDWPGEWDEEEVPRGSY